MGRMETKVFDFAVKSVGKDGALEGYASVKHEVDAYGDVIADGAYGDLSEFVREGFVSFGHDHRGVPIGFVTVAEEDAKGLFVGMKFHATPDGEATFTVARERMEAGKSVGLSIGYLPLEWRFEDRGGERVRVLEKLDLKEFSLVTMPAAKSAVATGVGRGRRETVELAEEWGRV